MSEGEVRRQQLLDYLDGYLDADVGDDFGPNGLQVEGRGTIRKIVTGVSASEALFRRARELEADAVLVHHGLFWNGDDRRLVGFLRRRVGALIEGDINLFAYHLPLDRHSGLGNNVLAARAFGIDPPRPFGEHEELPIGSAGELDEPLAPARFERRCEEVFGQAPLAFAHGPDPIRTAAFVSGAAERLFHQAIADGYDAFVTGEASEWVMNVARETGTHFFAAGHYATERLGVRELGRLLAREFGITVEFVDVPNPV